MNKEIFFQNGRKNHFFDHVDRISDYCKTYWPQDVEHILRVANEVCDQYFLFDLKWDMERTYEAVIFNNEIDWRYMPGNDPEFIYQLCRHRYFICLGQAYAMTKDEKYAKTFVKLLLNFIEKEPLHKEGSRATTWRSIEAGLRGASWTKAIRYFSDSEYLTDEVIDVFYESLLVHGQYLVDVYSPFRLISNWGILENQGLFQIAILLPDGELRDKWIGLALERLNKQISIQVMRDGVHWEQSPMYHNEVLHCFQDVIILATRNKITIPENILSKVKAMTLTNIGWKKPNHHQVMQGDSDDTDVRDLISMSGYLFKDEVFKYCGHYRLDFESVWDLGYGAAKEYEKLGNRPPAFTSIAFPDSGNYYMRSSWAVNANFMHFHSGTLGAGHGHSDKLHVDLFAQGEDILVDGGRYTYVAGEDRYYFKDPQIHNTITVDDKKFTICKDSWECTKLSQAVNTFFYSSEKYDFCQGGHLGYMDLDSSVFINRKVIYIKPNIYIINDELYTGGEHSYQQYFHFNENGKVTLINSDEKEKNRVVRYRGKKAAVDFHFLRDDLNMELYESKISRHYNKYVANTSLKNEFVGKGFTSVITVVVTKDIAGAEFLNDVSISKIPVKSQLKNITYDDSLSEAIKIVTPSNEYVVIISHQEVNSPTDLVHAGGCMGYGNVIVFESDKEREIGTVLKW